jgi:hypothetical protein
VVEEGAADIVLVVVLVLVLGCSHVENDADDEDEDDFAPSTLNFSKTAPGEGRRCDLPPGHPAAFRCCSKQGAARARRSCRSFSPG